LNDSHGTWVKRLMPYKSADNTRAILEIIATIVPFTLVWVGMWALMDISYALVLLLAIPAGGLMVRLFIIQHDCGHGALFSSKKANDWVGRVLGSITLTPYEYWRRLHAAHHASSGNLDKRGMGDIDTLTVDEYLSLGKLGRLKYRIYRHPLVLFVFGPAYLFLLRHRLPIGAMRSLSPWLSAIYTNIGILLVSAAVVPLVGLGTFLMIQIPVIAIAASIGVWLFYVQHQFPDTHWDKHPTWRHQHAALHGSSFYDLPRPIMWLTGNIGVHHVHHLSSRIPFHKLPKVIKDYPELNEIGRLSFWTSVKCVRLTLWDEELKALVSFKSLKGRLAA